MNPEDRGLQDTYARWLDRATKVAFTLSLGAFALYVSGVLPAAIPLAELPRFWGLPVDRFVGATGAARGWEWLARLRYGDSLNVAAVALIALVTPLCYARMLVTLAARRDWLQAALALAQLAVLMVAASGLLAASG